MTTYNELALTCSNCGCISSHRVMGSSNEFGSPDLDLRPPQMMRSTMNRWLQECKSCGLVSPNIQKETVIGLEVLKSSKYLNTISQDDPTSPFVRRAMIEAGRGQGYLAFKRMLCAAWTMDDASNFERALTFRLDAVKYLQTEKDLNIEQNLQLLDVLRRSGEWEEAEKLSASLNNESLNGNLNKILAFQADLISQRDQECHKVSEAFPSPEKTPEPKKHPTAKVISVLGRLRRFMGL